MRCVSLVVIVGLLAATAAVGVPATAGTAPSGPTIVAAYPNPVAADDAGEYVVVSMPHSPAPANATLSDGSTTVTLPDVGAGRVVLSRTPAAARNVTDLPVRDAPGLALANGGERLTVRQNGTTVHRVSYSDAPEGEVATWNGSAVAWRPLGATDRPVVRAGPGEVRAFVLPDSPEVPRELLASAEDRLLVGGYSLTSDRVADRLIAAHRRGVDVRVLLEGDLTGGRTRAGAATLDRLTDAGVDVRVNAGPHARYDYHHAKYAVADDRALVLTENWKPAGTGGNSSRGWGVVTDQPAVVENLTATFDADAGWRDAVPWATYRAGRSFERGERSLGGYPTNHEPAAVGVNATELLVTPDNARGRLLARLDDAEESVDAVQVTVGGWDDPFAVALRRAATRGVEVRLLLSDAWYAREDNAALVERFASWADRNDASLSARLAESDGRFEKIHAKGAIVDDSVVVGSLNWNEHAAEHNREVVLVMEGSAVAGYYRSVFEADWRSGQSSLPVGMLAGVGGSVALAGAVIARIRFEGSA